MKQVASILSTYSADTFGVCSALFELGGMIVIHDPSGCNSTYTTHDEPRWYDHDSLIYVSAMTERDAVLGDDHRLIEEIVTAARQQQPRFICLIPSQIAHLIGTDCRAICRILEKKTGIPAFTLPTNSMHYYERGIYLALEHLADWALGQAAAPARGCPLPHAQPDGKAHPAAKRRINLLGITPLDYGSATTPSSLKAWLAQNGLTLQACWAVGSSLEDIAVSAHDADCSLVMSYGGLGAARRLYETAGIPYVCGAPFGTAGKLLAQDLKACQEPAPAALWPPHIGRLDSKKEQEASLPAPCHPCYIIGETVFAQSLAYALAQATGQAFTAIVPVETDGEILAGSTLQLCDEDELRPYLESARLVIADPLYAPIVPATCQFIPLPHRGFSGRTYERQLPDLMDAAAYQVFLQEVLHALWISC